MGNQGRKYKEQRWKDEGKKRIQREKISNWRKKTGRKTKTKRKKIRQKSKAKYKKKKGKSHFIRFVRLSNTPGVEFHSGAEQPRIGTEVLGHLLVWLFLRARCKSFACSVLRITPCFLCIVCFMLLSLHCSLCFAHVLHCINLFTCSLILIPKLVGKRIRLL